MNKKYNLFIHKSVLAIATLFLIQFIIASSLYEDFVQGNLVKLFIIVDLATAFMAVSVLFFITYRKKISKIKFSKIKVSESFLFGFLCALTFLIYFWLSSFIFNNFEFVESYGIFFALLRYFILFFILLFLLLSIFGRKFLKQFWKKEIIFFSGGVLLVYFFIRLVHSLWYFFSSIATKIVYFLLNLTFDAEMNLSGQIPIISLELFRVGIAKPCSGISSLFLFAFLYVFAVIYDWKLFNKSKVVIMFFIGLLSVFVINIFRIYLLILIGAYISSDFAVGIFHTGIAGIFFVIYFAIFWGIFYKWMQK
jgi:exosortase/archaeosortase family protein